MAHMDHGSMCEAAMNLHNLPKDINGGKLQPMRGLVSSMSMKELVAETIKAESLIKLQENKIAILAEEMNLRKARAAKQAELDKYYTEQKDLPGTEWVFLTVAACLFMKERMLKKGEIVLLDANLFFGGYKCHLDTQSALTVKNLLQNGVRVWYSIQDPKHFKIFLRK